MFDWKSKRIAELNSGSTVVKTIAGPMEYCELGHGKALLSIHGGPGGYDQALMVAQGLGQGYRLICPSRPGYLRTPLSTGKTIEAQADALVTLLDKLGINQAAIAGYSAGGPIALQIALRHPERVWALILESAVTKKYVINQEKVGPLEKFIFLSSPGEWLINLLSSWRPDLLAQQIVDTEGDFDPDTAKTIISEILDDPRKVEFLQKLLHTMSPYCIRKEGLENDLKQLSDMDRYPLEHITAPTLICHGKKDADVPFEHAQFAADTIPGAELVAVEEGFHLLRLSEKWPDILNKEKFFLKALF
ncbi:MAG: alpha/beta hydrolase [Candidatus Eremiobacteraeota bacterium]|nr:alpha/beta hydrolase [Candidatus Eremiobacteraeota bacterium]